MTEQEILSALSKLQDGRCGICGDDDARRLVVDHCHFSGMIRGLLCDACNTSEGRHVDSCSDVERCPICFWRRYPAVSWVGATFAWKRSLRIRRWEPTETRIALDKKEQDAMTIAMEMAYQEAHNNKERR